MEEKNFKKEFQELKNLTLLSAKQALTMNDAALLIGISKSHLYKLVSYKKIPHYKSDCGKLTYFDKTELNAWCLKNRVMTTDEVETAAANYFVTGKVKKGGAL